MKPKGGRPKHRTVRDVALSLSAPSDWPDYPPPVYKYTGEGGGGAAYRPSAASAVRSSIPAAAVRIQEMEVAAGRARRSLSEIEKELVDRTHAQTANDTTTTDFRRLDSVIKPRIARVRVDGELRESGSSMSDFLFEDFYDGSQQPGELRGLKWSR